MLMLRVIAPHFVGRVDLNGEGVVVNAPPILRFTRQWSFDRFAAYCSRRRWQIESIVVEQQP